jgi:hypothetical protein
MTTGKHRAANTLSGLARSLEVAGQQVDERQGGVARLVQGAAREVDHAAQVLETTEIGEMADRAGRWARENPLLFLGGAFALGVLGARFFKASQTDGSATSAKRLTTMRDTSFEDREVPVPVKED